MHQNAVPRQRKNSASLLVPHNGTTRAHEGVEGPGRGHLATVLEVAGNIQNVANGRGCVPPCSLHGLVLATVALFPPAHSPSPALGMVSPCWQSSKQIFFFSSSGAKTLDFGDH